MYFFVIGIRVFVFHTFRAMLHILYNTRDFIQSYCSFMWSLLGLDYSTLSRADSLMNRFFHSGSRFVLQFKIYLKLFLLLFPSPRWFFCISHWSCLPLSDILAFVINFLLLFYTAPFFSKLSSTNPILCRTRQTEAEGRHWGTRGVAPSWTSCDGSGVAWSWRVSKEIRGRESLPAGRRLSRQSPMHSARSPPTCDKSSHSGVIWETCIVDEMK